MKGFGIEIKNNLLEPKHIENMGVAVWLYMFLIDKITGITDQEVGIVLGGRPVKYEEIKAELGISKNTYTRWIHSLETYPYIETTLAPYGTIFRVFKAHKRFTKNVKRFTKNASPGSPETGNVIKTDTIIDNTRTIYSDASVATTNQIIDLFKTVNPNHEKIFSNTTQRTALERMIKKHGAEKISQVIKSLQKSNSMEYAPTITTPVQLEDKLGALVAFWQKNKPENNVLKIR